MTNDQFIKGQLALLCWKQAHQQGGHNNMCAVAMVLRNRVRAGWGDWMEVLASHKDSLASFEVTDDWPNLRDPSFEVFLQKLDDVYAGMTPDLTQGALYYADLNNVQSAWFKEQILGNPAGHARVAQVGQVSFFK